MTESFYLSRGVSATKDDVHVAIADQDPGLKPGLFCKVVPDPAGDPAWCAALHADGSGSKSSVAYLMAQESGDPAWYAGLAQDAAVMNTDDLACVGATDGFYLSNTIGRHAGRVDAAALTALIGGYDRLARRLKEQGISLLVTGGETADVGDLVQTLVCDATVFVRFPRADLIDPSRIKPGQVVLGLASFGQMDGEEEENSGIGSNGLTAARHILLHSRYRSRYPESFASDLDPGLAYCGPWRLHDRLPGSSLTVGAALLSPTRTYLPFLRQAYRLHRASIAAAIHCTGGGLTKSGRFGHKIRYVKDQLFETPPLFEAIRETGLMPEQELYQVFNMGHRMELVCDPQAVDALVGLGADLGLAVRPVGYTEALDTAQEPANEVVIQDRGQTFSYRQTL